MHALALFAPRCRRDHAELCTREATERRMSEVLAEMRKQDRTLKDKLRSLRTPRHESGRTECDREPTYALRSACYSRGCSCFTRTQKELRFGRARRAHRSSAG